MGASSGKDPKVDRSSTCNCRQMTKFVVKSGLSKRCLVHSLSHLLLHPPDLHLRLHLPCLFVQIKNALCASANEETGSLANKALLTGYEPKFFDDYHFSETVDIFIQESSNDSRPSNLPDSEISDCIIGRALSSPLFTQERAEPAGRRQACHSLEESLLSSQSLSVGQKKERGDLSMSLVREFKRQRKSMSRLSK